MTADDLSTAYDTLMGTELWATHNTGQRPHTTPVLGDGNVYMSTDDALVALDVRSGREHWRHPTMSPLVLAEGGGIAMITPSGSDNPGDNELLAAQDGAVRWHGTLGRGPAAIDGDAIFVSEGGATGHCGD